MVNDVPLPEALCVAQVAQVVAVAPHLIGEFWVAHRRAVDIVIERVIALRQLLRQVPYVVQHLQEEMGQ